MALLQNYYHTAAVTFVTDIATTYRENGGVEHRQARHLLAELATQAAHSA